jgi:TRAP transporter 4TM/12TM fusion protein
MNNVIEVIKKIIIPTLSILFTLFFLYFAYTGFIERARFSLFFLLFCLLSSSLRKIIFFQDMAKARRLLAIILMFCFSAISVTVLLYLIINFNILSWRAGINTNFEYFLALMLLLPIMYLSWGIGGVTLFALIAFSIFYMFFGNIFPGILRHGGFTLKEFLEVQILSLSDSGLLGAATQVVATWVSIFIIYAGIMQGFGVFETIFKGSLILTRNRSILIPQLAVLSSLFFGSVSGAASANVGATGSFTIPLMKKFGMPPYVAGAIEAVASTGGQVMPPIMGSTAFLMASFLGVSYGEVMIHGFIPALLFYGVFAYSVYLVSQTYIASQDIGSDIEIEKQLMEVKFTVHDFVNLIPLLLSIVTICISLVIIQLEILQAALYGILTFLLFQIVVEFFNRKKVSTFYEILKKFTKGAIIGSMTAADIGVMVAGMSLLLKALTATSLAPKISYLMVDVAGNSIFLLMILTWIVCFVFGMAVSTLIVYLLVSVLVVPAMKSIGVQPMISHYIIFYLSSMAMITPPTAPASLVASGIAKASFMRTAFSAIKLGMPLFILPFAFIVYPEVIIINRYSILAIPYITLSMIYISWANFSPRRNIFDLVIRGVILLGGFANIFFPYFYQRNLIIIFILTVLYAVIIINYPSVGLYFFNFIRRKT